MTSYSRVFEKLMYSYNRLRGHLNDYNLLVDEKIGFRKNLTTEKANCKLLNEM